MRRDRLAIGGALAVLGAFAAAAGPASAELAAATPLTYTGAEQAYTVPAGVTWLGIDATGAPGWNTVARDGGAVGADNGGMEVSGALAVFPGEQLFADVGQAGQASGAATFGAGGAGGSGSLSNGGSGGGASDVRYCSVTAASCFGGVSSLQSRLLVAGGGGGSGGGATGSGASADFIDPLGGSTCAAGPTTSTCATVSGAGETVVDGGGAVPGFATQNPGWTGAGGGTASGGTPGVIPSGGMFQSTCTFSGSVAGATGGFGVGAAGGSGNANGGGGGGGGYYGGGGGASGRVASGCGSPPTGAAGGGGAGSSFIGSPIADGTYTGSGAALLAEVTLQPLIQILAPVNGATYAKGQVVTASYDCYYAAATSGDCAGPVPSGSPIDTSTPGTYTFTVDNTFESGATPVQTTVAYTVGMPVPAPTGSATITGVGTRHPKLVVTVSGSSGAGELTSLLIQAPGGVKFTSALTRSLTGSHSATVQLVHGLVSVKLAAPERSLSLSFPKSAIKVSRRLTKATVPVLVNQSDGASTKLLIEASVS